MNKVDLLSLYPNELTSLVLSLGEPKYRANQIFTQIHKGIDPCDITNIGKETKRKLSEATFFFLPKIKIKLVCCFQNHLKK